MKIFGVPKKIGKFCSDLVSENELVIDLLEIMVEPLQLRLHSGRVLRNRLDVETEPGTRRDEDEETR